MYQFRHVFLTIETSDIWKHRVTVCGLALVIDSECPQFPIQIRSLDSEGLGGFADSPMVPLQHGGNIFTFETEARLPKRPISRKDDLAAIQPHMGEHVLHPHIPHIRRITTPCRAG